MIGSDLIEAVAGGEAGVALKALVLSPMQYRPS